MRSSSVTTERATLQQYNLLRADAEASSWLLPHEQSTPNNTVKVEYGQWSVANNDLTIIKVATQDTAAISAPVSNPRIDLLSINQSGTLVRTAGTEAASPVMPELPAGNFAVARLHLRVGGTVFKDEDNDDSVNHYIEDIRNHFPQPIADVNYQTDVVVLSGHVTLDADDAAYQFLNNDGSGYNVTLSTTNMLDGRYFVIRHIGTAQVVTVKQSSTTLLILAPGEAAMFSFDSSNTQWRVALQSASAITGEIKTWPTNTAPSGFLFCNGQLVSRTTYANLFSAIGTTFGVGDGSTTFAVPDMRGRVIAGKDDMGGVSAASRLTSAKGHAATTLGSTFGTEKHALLTAEMPAHTHKWGFDYIGTNQQEWSGGNQYNGDNGSNERQYNTGSAGGGGEHENVQPSIVLNFIIKT